MYFNPKKKAKKTNGKCKKFISTGKPISVNIREVIVITMITTTKVLDLDSKKYGNLFNSNTSNLNDKK